MENLTEAIYNEDGNNINKFYTDTKISASDYTAIELLSLFKRSTKERLLEAINHIIYNGEKYGSNMYNIHYFYDEMSYLLYYDKKHFARLKKELQQLI